MAVPASIVLDLFVLAPIKVVPLRVVLTIGCKFSSFLILALGKFILDYLITERSLGDFLLSRTAKLIFLEI